jgi:hypothetical protein
MAAPSVHSGNLCHERPNNSCFNVSTLSLMSIGHQLALSGSIALHTHEKILSFQFGLLDEL